MQHIRPEQIVWEDPRARQYIMERGGSKNGAREFLRDTQPKLQKYLPHGDYLEPGADKGRFLKQIDFTRKKLVRACHPLDFFGMVDTIETHRADTAEEVSDCIRKIRVHAKRNKLLRSYMEYESGELFDGEVGILVQDYCGNMGGSIAEHPHEKGVYHIAHVMKSPGQYGEDSIYENIYDNDGYMLSGHSLRRGKKGDAKNRLFQPNPSALQEISMYRDVHESGLIPASWSSQVEFGYNTDGVLASGGLQFYQARLFRPYSLMADFDFQDLIDKEGKTHMRVTQNYGAYGITPPSGLDLMPWSEMDAPSIRKVDDHKRVAYAYNASPNLQRPTPLHIQPRNMEAFLGHQPHTLEHGYFRWTQKAPVSLHGICVDPDTTMVKVFSDGFRGGVQFLR